MARDFKYFKTGVKPLGAPKVRLKKAPKPELDMKQIEKTQVEVSPFCSRLFNGTNEWKEQNGKYPTRQQLASHLGVMGGHIARAILNNHVPIDSVNDRLIPRDVEILSLSAATVRKRFKNNKTNLDTVEARYSRSPRFMRLAIDMLLDGDFKSSRYFITECENNKKQEDDAEHE